MKQELEIVWLAGLLEGEGCFLFNRDVRYPKIKLKMVDEDIVHRAADLFGKLGGKRPVVHAEMRDFSRQQIYRIELSGKYAKNIMLHIVKYMGFRRRKKIWQILNEYDQPKMD